MTLFIIEGAVAKSHRLGISNQRSVKPLHWFSASLVRTSAALKSTGPGLGQMSQKENFWSSWRERLSALRNVPPVLKIVWQSGPGVVSFGVVANSQELCTLI